MQQADRDANRWEQARRTTEGTDQAEGVVVFSDKRMVLNVSTDD